MSVVAGSASRHEPAIRIPVILSRGAAVSWHRDYVQKDHCIVGHLAPFRPYTEEASEVRSRPP